MFFDVKNNKSWMAILLCVSMTVGNMAPAFSYGTNIGDPINEMEEKKQGALDDIQEDIKDVLQNGLSEDDELFFGMHQEVVEEEIIIKKTTMKNDVADEEDVPSEVEIPQ